MTTDDLRMYKIELKQEKLREEEQKTRNWRHGEASVGRSRKEDAVSPGSKKTKKKSDEDQAFQRQKPYQ